MRAVLDFVIEGLQIVIYRIVPFACALFVGFLFYNALDRRIPVTIMSGEVTPTEVRAGDEAVIQWEMQWTRSDCVGTVEPEVVSDEGVIWKYASINVYGPSNLDGVARPFYVPRALHPGTAHYRGRVFFVCNWFQRFFPLQLIIPDVPFNVIAR